MNINFLIETILILFAILASNGIIYSLTFFTFNSSENISVITNSLEKDGLALTSLIASNPLRLISSESNASDTVSMTSSESNASDTLSVISSDTNVSDTLSVTSSDTYVDEDIFESDNLIDSEISDRMMTHTENSYLSSTNEGNIPSNVDIFENTTSLDSMTILNSQTLEQWRDAAMTFHEFPINTPAGILQQFKLDELNILYSQDIIHFGITQTELRLIIEHLPAMSLFDPGINHLILTIMSYYHL